MTTLEAYNLILAKLGLPPIHDLETRSKTVAIVGDSLDRSRKKILRDNPHRFGRLTSLNPNEQGRISVAEYLRFVPPTHLKTRLSVRNGFLWDIHADDYYPSQVPKAVIVEAVSFDNIDSYAWQEYIALDTSLDVEQRVNGPDGANYAVIYQQLTQAKRSALNEHPRNRIDNAFGLGSAMRGFYE